MKDMSDNINKSLEDSNFKSSDSNPLVKQDQNSILVVEDDDFNYLMIETLLSLYNYHTIRAINGEEAVNICRQNKNLTLILMDIHMPVMDGFTATKNIRKNNKKIPIIAQTAFEVEEVKEKAIKSGCNDFITKPSMINHLIPLVEKYVAFYTSKVPNQNY
ncbi:MAG: response regulator [Bacteroidota bacterium]